MSPDFRIGEAHLYPAEPAGSTRTTETIDGEKRQKNEGRDAHISSSNSENFIAGSTNPASSAIVKQK